MSTKETAAARSRANGHRPKPATIAELQKSREIVALSPSGNYFKLRPLNLERHALAGGLPAHVRKLALEGAEGINKLFGEEDSTLSEEGEKVRDYLDGLVTQLVVEPDLKGADLDDVLLPADYRWFVSIAMGEEDRDGEGRLMWGREPLSRWATFREEHRCGPDCAACRRVQDAVSAALR